MQMADNSLNEYNQARREMSELLAVMQMIEQKMQLNLGKIQSAHEVQGDVSKSLGDVCLEIQEFKGSLGENVVVKVSLQPEDACKIMEADISDDIVTWGENSVKTITYSSIESREATIHVSIEETKKEDDFDSLHDIIIPVVRLIKEPVDQWYPVVAKSTESEVESSEPQSESDVQATSEPDDIIVAEELPSDSDNLEAGQAADSVPSGDAEIPLVAEKEVPALYIKASLKLSEVESLAQTVMVLSQQKKELEVARKVAEQRLIAAKKKYDQAQSLKSNSVPKSQRRALLQQEGRPANGVSQRTWWQKAKSAMTPQRMQLCKSIAMFTASVFVFHYHGENFDH